MAGNKEYVCTLSPELVEKAQKELNEKPEWRSRDIQALREMVEKHPGTNKLLNKITGIYKLSDKKVCKIM